MTRTPPSVSERRRILRRDLAALRERSGDLLNARDNVTPNTIRMTSTNNVIVALVRKSSTVEMMAVTRGQQLH